MLILHACDRDPRGPNLLSKTSPSGVFVANELQIKRPRASLGRNFGVLALQSQGGGNSREQSIRPIMIPRGFVRHIADSKDLGRATRASQQKRTVLKHCPPTPPLRAADDFDAIGYDIFRIDVRKA
jgi:hypothetical protein